MAHGTHSCIYFRNHFALAVVVNPWGCIGENGATQMTVLYFDLMHEWTPLATQQHFATVMLELHAIQLGKAVTEPVTAAVVSTVKSWIVFELVQVHQPQHLTGLHPSCQQSFDAFQVPQQPVGSVACGLYVIHYLQVLCKKWKTSVDSIVSLSVNISKTSALY